MNEHAASAQKETITNHSLENEKSLKRKKITLSEISILLLLTC